ncbi:hypothetical protein BN7_3243 [Wickerhamomyces ciferrii]|uniref:Uncharacterized protein n=1 Tax=Wickerhamomyces ciferrii (strain ATCC 14091 / BCRC 22168 / CBS 111 / JCM 3599 / NBRC 0793 / NRRL Y-1031 F-60-10) TaxID=1206466 RepID=K0KQT8_WICCF|nr:uncharacterized protein BN7_3243 [Wickerhamomyces ciferrii]CCH43689.1 hypothetical protein BN7_3243 [Wickerhamomyces ciferrii]
MFKPIRYNICHELSLLSSSLFFYHQPALLGLKCFDKKFHSSSLRYQQDALTKAKNVLNYQFSTIGSYDPGLEFGDEPSGDYNRVRKKEDYWYLELFSSKTNLKENKRYFELFKKSIYSREDIHIILDTEDIMKYSCDTDAWRAGSGKCLEIYDDFESDTEEHFYKACLIVFNDGDKSKALQFDLKFYASHHLVNGKPSYRDQRMEIESITHHEGSELTIEGMIRNYVGTVKKDDKLSPMHEKELFKAHEFKKKCHLHNTKFTNENYHQESYIEGKGVSWWKRYKKSLKLKEEKQKAHKKTFENFKMYKFDRLDPKTQKAFHDYIYHHLKINEYIYGKAVHGIGGIKSLRAQYFGNMESFTNTHSCENPLIKVDYNKVDSQENCQACKDFEALKEKENRQVILDGFEADAEYDAYEPYSEENEPIKLPVIKKPILCADDQGSIY